MLLARAGRSVALVDRATFPSDTMSTHFLWPRGVSRLAEWALLDELWDRGCVPISEITFDPGPVQLLGAAPPVNGTTLSCCPRRTVLDAVLVEAAAAAGADVVQDYVVDDVTWAQGRATGVTGRARTSSIPSAFRGRLVVGADGLQSTVAARVGARPYRYEPPMTCVYYSYWSGIQGRAAMFYARPGQLVLVWPTNDDLTCVYVAWPAADFGRVRSDRARSFQAAIQDIPQLADRLAGGQQVAPLTGTRNLPNQYVISAGQGWALVGDAGHHKDPCTGMGISDAFTSAALLAQRVTDVLDDETGLDRTLAGYQSSRDAETSNGYDLTLKTARLAPLSARMQAFYRGAAHQPAESQRIFGVLGGTIPVSDLYGHQPVEPVRIFSSRR
jgi:2-polyprenyl-6-methoxyphenol hydroxylase-like FAD-dependent oxidoreductase